MPGTYLEFDLYPPDDPAGKISGTGIAAKLATFTVADQLVDAGFVGELFGLGSGFIEIHVDDPDADLIAPRSYVKVKLTDGGFFLEELGGFFLERAELKVLSKRGQVERVVHWEGEGGALGLDRYVLGHSVYATGQTKRGDINVPGKWHWSQEPYGAILARVLEEGTDHPDGFYEFFDYDFTRTLDSNGNAWSDVDDYEVPIGTSGLKLWSDFLRLGLVAEVDADLRIHAYRRLSEYRTDRHSASFASGKVRFEAGQNIASEMVKRINPSSQRTHVLIEDRIGDYQTFDEDVDGNPIGGVPYMAFLKSTTTADDSAIANMGALHLTYRNQFTDVCKVKHDLGPGGANGEEGYRPAPGGDYWLGDLVTVHSGTGEHDYNEQTIEVAALRYFLQGKDWLVEAELGAQYRNAQQASFQASIAQTIIQQLAALQLCQADAEIEQNNDIIGDIEVSGGTLDNSDLPSGAQAGDLAIVLLGNVGLAAIPAGGSPFTLLGSGGTTNDGPGSDFGFRVAYRFLTAPDIASGSWAFTNTERIVGSVYRNVTDVQALANTQVGSAGNVSSVFELPPVTLTVGDGSSWIWGAGISNIDPGLPALTGLTGRGEVQQGTEGGSRAYDSNGGVSSFSGASGALSPSSGWSGYALELVGSGIVRVAGDGREELVGTSIKAKRCDDTEHWHATGSDAPSVTDDVDAGFRPGTLWVNDDGDAWIAFDVSAGAADWIAISTGGGGGVTDHGALTGLGDDDHPQYATDTDLTTHAATPHGGAPTGADYLVGTAQAGLSAEIVVGTSPGGELGGTWASPTVDATHSGSAHHTEDHDHDGSPTQKLAQANTHESPDTDTGSGSLHHTLGSGAAQAAAGNHTHGGGGSSGTTIGTGTSFPGSPSNNDLFYRTDRDLLYFYDSGLGIWLSLQEYQWDQGWDEHTGNVLTATSTLHRWSVRNDFGIYLLRWNATSFFTNATPGTNFMTVALSRVTAANAATQLGSFVTSSDTQNQWTNHDQSIVGVLDASAKILRTVATESGSVAGFQCVEHLTYRLIG